jgi:hypothetical protein
VSRLTIKVPPRGVYIAELSTALGWRGLVMRPLCGRTVTYQSVDLHYIQEQSPLTSTIHAQPWKMEDGLGGARPHTTGGIRDKGVRLVGGGLDDQSVSPRHLQSNALRCWLRYPSYLQRVCRNPASTAIAGVRPLRLHGQNFRILFKWHVLITHPRRLESTHEGA